ncbi:MAG: ribonuclease HIII [Terriglobales bacterium]
MNDDSRELDQLIRTWWLGGRDEGILQEILERTLTCVPANLIPYTRALQILEAMQFGQGVHERLKEARRLIENLRSRELQADSIGDVNNEPQALFAILSDTDIEPLGSFDPEPLRKIRLAHQESRAKAAEAFLDALGWNRLSSDAAQGLRQAVSDLLEREQYQSWGLFVVKGQDQGLALGVKLVVSESGQELFSDADSEMRNQARIAAKLELGDRKWDGHLEWPASFEGESIGLPLYVAALVARNTVPAHALTASTGKLDIDGRVRGVNGIPAKVRAAARVGMRRVLVPRENFDEAKAASDKGTLILPIEHVKDVVAALRQPISPVEIGHSTLVLIVRASAPDYQLVVQDEKSTAQGRQFVLANASGTVRIWVYNNGGVRAEGPAGAALEAANLLIKERVPPDPEQRGTMSFHLPTRLLQQKYKTALELAGAIHDEPHNYEAWRIQLSRGRSRATIVTYTSNKCVVQGTAPAWDDAVAIAEPLLEGIGGLPTVKSASHSATSDKAATDEESEAHIGTDEAGKGDYFGPLVSAAVFVDAESAGKLRALGVRDSKLLSDNRIAELAERIRSMPSVRSAVIPINPKKYNELYEQFRREGKNLNSLLAWGHARSIDAVLSAPVSKRVSPKFVIVDQFADKRYIEQRTNKFGIPIHQRPKAEADIAVAAASILARDAFVKWLDRMSERTQILLPKGASPQVVEAARQFVLKWGSRWLREVAKLHFRTTEQVLGSEEKDVDARAPKWVSETTEQG